jgi:hypothetical protein
VKRILSLALLLPALAARAESPRSGAFDVRFSGYRPDIDSEFGGTATPYKDAFGTSQALLVQALVSSSLLVSDVATLDLGLGAGYWEKRGVGVCYTCSPVVTGDRTSMRVVPLTVAATLRVDWLFYQLRVPLAPYLRGAVHDYLWWTYDGGGSVSAGPTGQHGSGQTMGWSVTGGVGLVLDFFDAQMAREMDYDTGVNHTILLFDVTKARVDGFGSKSSWNLSPDTTLQWSIGLMFVF